MCPKIKKKVARKVANVSQNLEKLLGCVKIRGLAKVLQNLKRCTGLSRRKYNGVNLRIARLEAWVQPREKINETRENKLCTLLDLCEKINAIKMNEFNEMKNHRNPRKSKQKG